PVAGPVQVTSSGTPSQPAVGVDALGNSYVVWTTDAAYFGSIYGAKLDPEGNVIVPAQQVSEGQVTNPDVAVTPDGVCIVVGDKRGTTDHNVHIYRRTSDLGPVCVAKKPGTAGIGDGRVPAVEADASGIAHVLFRDVDIFNYYIKGHNTDAGCGPSGSTTVLTGDYARPAIAWSGVQEWRTVESGNNIYTIAGGLHRINDQAGTASYARLANTSPNGLAVFQDSRSGDFDIYCTAFNGATGFPDLRVTADPAAQQYPDVAVLPSLPGEFWVVWQDYRDGNWEIYLTRSLGDEPHLALEPLHFGFAAVPGGPLPAGQELTITISGGGTPAWEADSDQPWLNVTPASGTGSGSTVNLSVNTTALPAGTYEANVAVACAEADNSPQTATVTYVVWG
ncbi:MAG TPA: hypothetical protein PKY95_12840, partial [candidate division Zixibacteria bacterium]|nr:hypothetical protein [candidate division Zixibacteria bacterium]